NPAPRPLRYPVLFPSGGVPPAGPILLSIVDRRARPRPGAEAMAETHLNLIGGRWVKARSGRTFANHNPATGEALGDYPASGPEDVDAAVAAAAKAYPAWRLTPAPRRAE